MKISLFNTFKKNSIDTYIKNKIIKQNQKKVDEININNKLDKITNQSNAQSDISSTIEVIRGLYAPIQSEMQSLALNINIYNKNTELLKNSSLTEEERSEIQSQLNSAQKNISEMTSQENVSSIDNYLNKRVAPAVADLEVILKGEIGQDIDTDKFEIKSMEELGINPIKNSDFSSILKESSNAISAFFQKIVSLDNLDKKYGEPHNNRQLPPILDLRS